MPVPSSPLVAEPPVSRDSANLAAWLVTVRPFTTEGAVSFLSVCVGKHTLAPGVIISHDLAFWTRAMRFAGSLVARQRFLPGLESKNGKGHAVWEPVLSAEDRERLLNLAKEMPPVARALSSADASSPPHVSPPQVLLSFLTDMVDYLVRSANGERTYSAEVEEHGRRWERRPKQMKRAEFESLHDQWLYALRAPSGDIQGDEAEFEQLARQAREWRRPIAVSEAAPLRLCFRLEEPRDAEQLENERERDVAPDSWYVRYLLQPLDDQSLLIPVEDAWNPKAHKRVVLKRYGINVREHLLASLGQAACLCPRIESSLKTSAPGGYELDSAGAHEFLADKSIALEQAGFCVMLPAWWTRKGTKLRLTASAQVKSPSMKATGMLSLDAIAEFRWEIALGDEKLTLSELEALARLKTPLVRIRGQWVEMNSEEIKAAIDFWKKKAAEKATVREIVQMKLGVSERTHGIQFAGVTADGWIDELFEQLEGRRAFEELETHEKFSGVLRPYQVRGFSWLAFLRQWGFGACLADDMGLGKTIQTLALIQRDWESGARRPVLLVCPTSVVNNWQKEASRFTPKLPVMAHHGLDRKKGEQFKEHAEKHAIVVSTYALLHRDLEHLQAVEWAGVILDEAQNIKNPETKQAKAACSMESGCRIALTGTPVENNVGDLWSIMHFLNPGFLGTQADFRRNFFIPIQAGRDPEAADRLKRITSPFVLRRLKTDKSIIDDLPEKLEMKVFCTLTKEQASLYTAVLKELEEPLESAEGIQRKGLVLAALSKLKQVCNHPAQFLGDNSSIPGRSGKVARLTEMLEEIIEVGDRALVFSQFAEMGEILKRHLQDTFGREILFLHGGVPKKQRDQMVERFQGESSDTPIFVLSLKAGGLGLNLIRANHVFHFDRWWNPAVENQATDRAFRIGQTKNVQVHKFLCAGTLEEKIDEMIERKKDIAEKVVGTGEGWLTELSNRDLKEIFALRTEIMGD
jgi:SNF2 family DNA or RNA helicase